MCSPPLWVYRRAVIRCIDNQRILAKSQFVQFVQQASRFEIEFFDDIAVQTARRSTAKFGGGVDDGVHHGMSEIQHKRLIGIALVFQVIDGFVGVEFQQASHVLGF